MNPRLGRQSFDINEFSGKLKKRSEEAIRKFQRELRENPAESHKAFRELQEELYEALSEEMDIDVQDEIKGFSDEEKEQLKQFIAEHITWIFCFEFVIERDDVEELDAVDSLLQRAVKRDREGTKEVFNSPAFSPSLDLLSGFQKILLNVEEDIDSSKRLENKIAIFNGLTEGFYRTMLTFLRNIMRPAYGHGKAERIKLGGLMHELEDIDIDMQELLQWKALDIRNATAHPEYSIVDNKIRFLKPQNFSDKGLQKTELTEEELDAVRKDVYDASYRTLITAKNFYKAEFGEAEDILSPQEMIYIGQTVNKLIE